MNKRPRGQCRDCGKVRPMRTDGTMYPHPCVAGSYVSFTTTGIPMPNWQSEIDAAKAKRCARCGFTAGEHLHMFGSEIWLCPTVQTFLDPEPESPTVGPPGEAPEPTR